MERELIEGDVLISCAISSSLLVVRLARKTLKPAPASWRAKSRPMPAVAPVTTVRGESALLKAQRVGEEDAPAHAPFLAPKRLSCAQGGARGQRRRTSRGGGGTHVDARAREVDEHPHEAQDVAPKPSCADEGEGEGRERAVGRCSGRQRQLRSGRVAGRERVRTPAERLASEQSKDHRSRCGVGRGGEPSPINLVLFVLAQSPSLLPGTACSAPATSVVHYCGFQP